MKKFKIFISGPMSSYKDYNKPLFDKCQKELEKAGFAVFNPAWLQFDDTVWSKGDMMAIDIYALRMCDAICLLPGHSLSEGAGIEKGFSKRMDIPLIYYYPCNKYEVFNCDDTYQGLNNENYSEISRIIEEYNYIHREYQ